MSIYPHLYLTAVLNAVQLLYWASPAHACCIVCMHCCPGTVQLVTSRFLLEFGAWLVKVSLSFQYAIVFIGGHLQWPCHKLIGLRSLCLPCRTFQMQLTHQSCRTWSCGRAVPIQSWLSGVSAPAQPPKNVLRL